MPADEIWLLVLGMQMSRGTKRNTKSRGQESQARRTEAEAEPGKQLKITKAMEKQGESDSLQQRN